MAQTWSAQLLCRAGLPGPMIKHSAGVEGPTAFEIWSCVGPASSVSDGSAISISSDVAGKVYGGAIIAHDAGNSEAYDYRLLVSAGASTFSTSSFKIQAIRVSAGAALTSAVSLSTEAVYLMRYIGA